MPEGKKGIVRNREESESVKGEPPKKMQRLSEGELYGAIIAAAADVVAKKNNITVNTTKKQEIAKVIRDLPENPGIPSLGKACDRVMGKVKTNNPHEVTKSDAGSIIDEAISDDDSISNKSLSRAAVDKIRDTLSDSATRANLIAVIMGLIGTFGPGAVLVDGVGEAASAASSIMTQAGSISDVIDKVVKFVRRFWSN